MMIKKLVSGLLISSMAVMLAAAPVMAAEAFPENESEGTEILNDAQNEIPSEEIVSEENLSEEIPTDEYIDGSSQDDNFQSEEESVQSDIVYEEDSDEEEADEETDQVEDSDYGIVTLDNFPSEGFGLDSASGDWYYFANGKIDTGRNDVIYGTVDGVTAWWYVVGGKVRTDFTGLADYPNSNGWWYIENGKVTFSKDTIAHNKNGWYYVKDSKVDFSFTGLADFPNENGWWYCENGKVTFAKDTIAHNKNGWYYVKDSKVDFSFTGLADFPNENGWWYCENGKVTFAKDTIAHNKNGWYYVKDSKVDFSFTGLADFPNENGWWYCDYGKVTFAKDTIAHNKNGWYYVKDSKVDFSFTGLADFPNENGWWYCENGKVLFDKNTVAKNKNGWYYVKDSKVDFSFNGIANNSNGWWYIKDGKVDFSYNGKVTVSGGTYSVVDGKVQNVNLSGVVSSEITDLEERSYDYTVPGEYVKYGGTDTNQLSAPQFTGTVNGNGTMTLTWEPVSGAEKYRVFRREYNDSDWTIVADTTATTYTDNKYAGETTVYFYTVRCINAAGTKYTSPYISSFSGSAVAEYGQLFVGNPYVYGGTSLTNGCDCSGFVMQVYAHFGVLMYHYSGAQRQIGKEVSYSNAQPGDIMGYDGHTGIYIGNGKMVHASTSDTGIIISDVNTSRNGFGVRRIF